MIQRKYTHAFKKVHNRGTPPQEFLDTLVDWMEILLNENPEVFKVNAFHDIYTNVRAELGPWRDLRHRAAVMCEVLRVLGGFESSWNWAEGRDITASNFGFEEEAGIFQTSANSMSFDDSLKACYQQYTGLRPDSTKVTARAFILTSKANKQFAIEYTARLLRFTVNHHGPVKRKEINQYLSKEAVEEFYKFLPADGELPSTTPTPVGIPPKPKSYDDVYRIFGNPRESGWARNNLAFCKVDDRFKEMPYVDGKGRGFYCHKLLVGQFQKCFQEIIDQGLWDDEFYSWEGCYNLRNIAGSTNLSLHSWAIAIDFNYTGNEYGDSTPSMDKKIVAIFKKHGFFWGGDYRGKKDGMHFEWYSR